MKFKLRTRSIVLFILSFVTILYASGGFSSDQDKLRKVEKSKTCMGSNMYAGKDSSAFIKDNKKYYGCSEMCLKNLELNTIYRYGTDPVSGKIVDKAIAIVAANESGKLFYFENEETFKAFR